MPADAPAGTSGVATGHRRRPSTPLAQPCVRPAGRTAGRPPAGGLTGPSRSPGLTGCGLCRTKKQPPGHQPDSAGGDRLSQPDQVPAPGVQAQHLQHPVGRRRAAPGLSLLELVVVLGLTGVLAALAWPAWTDHLRKVRRLDAQHALQALHLAQTRWRSAQGQYADTLEALGWPGTRSGDGHYQLSLENIDASGYTLVATGQGSQADDLDCNPMRLQLLHRATLVLGGGPDNLARCWR
jgi:type IV pilus assembly protein PilE